MSTNSNLDNFNALEYVYLNPEIEIANNLITVEDIVSYYLSEGIYDTTTIKSIVIPIDFNYKIYYFYNKNYIKGDLPALYNLYSANDPERLSIIHYMRNYQIYLTNNDIKLKYSIPKDFSIEMYKTFNDMSLDYLMPSEYYIKYIEKSNTSNSNTINIDGSDVNLTIGTISDFMINLFNRKFSQTLQINSDMNVSGQIVTSNLKVKDTFLASNVIIDTLTVTNNTFTETLFQDGVKLEKQLTVYGSNSIFTSNVQIKELLITNTSQFDGNVLMNCNLDVRSNTILSNVDINGISIFNYISYHKSNVYFTGLETSISNNAQLEYVTINNTLQVVNDSTFSNNMFINSNLIVNSNINVYGKLEVNSNTTLNNILEVKDNVAFSNNLNVKNIITATEYLTISDHRIKNNIYNYDIKEAKNIINNLDIKEYNILNNNHRKHLGIIAQELELLKKDLVHNTPNYKIPINKYTQLIDNKTYFLEKHNFALNDTIIYSINSENMNEIFESKINYVNDNLFSIDDFKFDKIFIRERIISNFKSVNYTELLMLCICCIQDLYNKFSV